MCECGCIPKLEDVKMFALMQEEYGRWIEMVNLEVDGRECVYD